MSNTKSAESTLSEPIFNRQALVRLILPLLAEQFLSVSMGMADTLMVSGVGEAAVSSVSLVDSLNILIIQILSALATGGAVIASQYLGRRDEENASRSAAQLYSVLGISTVAVGVVCMLLSRLILRIVFGSIDEDVMRFAQQYFLISAVSYPFIGLYNGGAALFRAQGNSRISMLASLVMNVINIAGNALLIYGFGMGVIGAALATLIGRVFAAVFILWQNQDLHNPLRVQRFADLRPRRRPIMQILSIGIPSGLENGMFQIGKLSVSSLVSTFGTAAIAANSVANSVTMFANIPGNAIGMAMITVIGQCIGAKKPDEAKRYGKKLMFIAYAGILATNIVMTIVAVPVVGLFHLSPEATKTGLSLIHCFSIVAIFIWPLSFTMPNALRAAGDAKYTMMVSIFSMWAFRVGSSYLLGGTLGLGVLGVWFGMFIDWGFRSLLFLIRFLRGKWTQKAVI